MFTHFKVCATAVLIAVAACGRTSAPPEVAGISRNTTDTITAARDGDNVVIHNTSPRPILFATLDRHYFDTALASYCFGNAGCGTVIEANRSSSVPIAAITGVNAASQSVLVFWWTSTDEPPPGGTVAAVNRIVVPIH